MIRLQSAPIDLDALIDVTRADGDGAVSCFLGTVRNVNGGKDVLFLEYEAYGPMAESEMARIADEAVARFGVTRVSILHRTGRVAIGEASVAIAVASPHRAAAMAACTFVIDTLKATVPIWKREHFAGGSVWVEGSGGDAPR